MELIDRYVAAVGRKIWSRDRADIERELRSVLQDQVDERGGPKNLAADDVERLLKEYGSPAEVAARYYPEDQRLIGPVLFPVYLMVLKIVLLAVGIGIAVARTLMLWDGGFVPLGLWFTGVIGGVLSAWLTSFGSVTLVFALIERFADPQDLETDQKDWDPADLPPLVQENARVSRPAAAASLLFLALALIVLNLYGEHLGLYYRQQGGGFASVSLFVYSALARNLWLLNVILIASAARTLVLLRTGIQTMILRGVGMAITVCAMFLVVRLWSDRPFFQIPVELPPDITPVLTLLESMAPFVLGIVFLGLAADLLSDARQIWMGRQQANETEVR